MGKEVGFIQYSRELPPRRSPQERVGDYNEFAKLYTGEKLNQQASRCMDCGVPFCHNGCPLGNDIPAFNEAVYRESWQEAYEILAATNNFPEFTGRICPAPCESACVLGINQPAVTIEEIEKHVIEIAFSKGFVKANKQHIKSGKKVAIVGSGPAGLAAAAQLISNGHHVVVYERDDAAGGLLRYGIPDFKLEKSIIDRRIKLMEEEGVIFVCNANIGTDISIEEIRRESDAVILTCGSAVPRDLEIPGRHLNGVHFAMEYLKQQNKRVSGKSDVMDNSSVTSGKAGNESSEILATGKNVIVIGGGDTGSDCVGTANRQDAQNISQFELLPQPPGDRTLFMPWPLYPMVLKTTSSHEEGVNREWSVATKEFIGEDGKLKALKVVSLDWTYSLDGRPISFSEIVGSEREIPCELALLSMGFLHVQHDGLVKHLELGLDEKGNIKADPQHYETNISGIFTAGDMRRGQSLVVWAIAEGRECASAVDEYLRAK